VLAADGSFTLLQMNLCLSGFSGCYGTTAYPAGVDDAVARIRQSRPDAVTINEACHRDAREIARRAGYHVRFTNIIYLGELLPCVSPGGRGLFGDAVLTKARIETSSSRPFEAQFGPEERRWLCVSTRLDQRVCTTHLDTRTTTTYAATNAAQCIELTSLLARQAAGGPVVFGGDVNRPGSCAPDGFWARSDRSAGQAPGLQHVYGNRSASRSARAQILPAEHSDHDMLLVRATLRSR